MKLLYRITVIVQSSDLEPSVPVELKEAEVFRSSYGEFGSLTWTFYEPSFNLIPKLREWARSIKPEGVIEEGLRVASEKDARSAPLGLLSGGAHQTAKVLEESLFREDICDQCGYATVRLRDEPKLCLQLPKRPTVGLFYVPRAKITVASAEVFQALIDVGLAHGLSTFPVDVEQQEPGSYLGLYSHVDLGWPAAPFGLAGEVCSKCGRSVIRSLDKADKRIYPGLPRYSMYLTFEHPKEEADWMWTQVSGQNFLYVTREIFDWILGKGAKLVGSDSRQRKKVSFSPYGWYPDEAEVAFLDAKYR